MKLLKYIPLAAVLASTASITSCNKKLDEYNPSGSTADAVWSTPAGFITAVNAAYFETRYWYGKEDGTILSEGGTDIWFAPQKGTYAKELVKYEAFTSAQTTTANAWKSLWKGVNQANAGINRIDQAGFTDPVEKNNRLAELRFLRAFYYYHIVEQWGGVMLRTTETTGALLTATRSTPEEFYDVMIGDLEFAKDNLPTKWANEWSRATKKSALGLLARVYLARASYSGDATSWYTKARNTAQEVINRKTEFEVDLWASYADMWKPANNDKNKEALFTLSNSSTNTQSNYDGNASRMHMFYMSQYTARPGMVRDVPNGREDDRKFMPTDYLLGLYQDADSRYEGSFKEVWICNQAYTWTAADVALYGKDASFVGKVMKVGDTATVISRKSVTAADKALKPYVLLGRDDIYNTTTNDTIIPTFSNTYVQLNKFVDPNRTSKDQRQGYNDIFPIRLAEMYLIGAEAEFRLGNPGAAATFLNVLRTRAAKSGQVAAMQCSASDITLQYILDERAREMCGEFQRWFDLKRTMRANNGADWVNYIKTKNPDIIAVQPYHTLRPVPLTELSGLTNREEFGQNAGY